MIDQHSDPCPPLLVKLPVGKSDFFREHGYAESNIFEKRGSARLRIRCEARLELTSSPPFITRTAFVWTVLVKDLSRSGLSILCHFQLYPLESFSIKLLGRDIQASVVRCRKLGASCYEIGGRISSIHLPDGTEQ